MKNIRLLLLFACSSALAVTAGCSRQHVSVPAVPNMPPSADYLDLKPDGTIRIVVPLLKSGGFLPTLTALRDGSYSSADLTGYEVSYYAVRGKSIASIRLQFISAEATRDGKTIAEQHPPALPFPLPRRSGYIRLVYLVRVSQADHNMAIVAAKRLEAVNAFTKHLRENPGYCQEKEDVFCAWIPAGIAVRPEKP